MKRPKNLKNLFLLNILAKNGILVLNARDQYDCIFGNVTSPMFIITPRNLFISASVISFQSFQSENGLITLSEIIFRACAFVSSTIFLINSLEKKRLKYSIGVVHDDGILDPTFLSPIEKL